MGVSGSILQLLGHLCPNDEHRTITASNATRMLYSRPGRMLEFLTDLAAAFGPKRVFSSVECVMKLISKNKRAVCRCVGIRRTVSAYGTVTRLAPAGRHPGPPSPSHHIQSFMKKNQRPTQQTHWQLLTGT